MRVLLISALLYLSGVVVMLYLRPESMFHRDGRWKEFGLHTLEGTIFPFWMFCIAWAFISYFTSSLFGGGGSGSGSAREGESLSSTLKTFATVAAAGAPFSGIPGDAVRTVAKNDLIQENQEDNQIQPLPVPVIKRGRIGNAKIRMRGGGGGGGANGSLKRGYYVYVGDDSEGDDAEE